MLVSMKPILDAARDGHYCVPAPNFFNTEHLKNVLRQQKNSTHRLF